MNQKTREALEIEAKYNLELESNYIPLNVWSIKVLGLDAALMLAALYEEHLYQRSKGNNGHFQCSIKMIKDRLGMSEERQRKAIKVLVNKGLVHNYLNRFLGNDNHINKRVRMFEFDFGSYGYKKFLDELKSTRDSREMNKKPKNDVWQSSDLSEDDLPF